MRVALLIGLALGCTRSVDRIYVLPDLAGEPVDFAAGMLPDLDPAPVDLAVAFDLVLADQALSPAPDLMPHCGDDGEPCCPSTGDMGCPPDRYCGKKNAWCNQPYPALACSDTTKCVSCGIPSGDLTCNNGLPTQHCCAGDPTTHVGGACEDRMVGVAAICGPAGALNGCAGYCF